MRLNITFGLIEGLRSFRLFSVQHGAACKHAHKHQHTQPHIWSHAAVARFGERYDAFPGAGGGYIEGVASSAPDHLHIVRAVRKGGYGYGVAVNREGNAYAVNKHLGRVGRDTGAKAVPAPVPYAAAGAGAAAARLLAAGNRFPLYSKRGE